MLWTRLAPEPADPASLGRATIPVGWRVATDSRMRLVVARGVAVAPAELAHSVHVEVDGLLPGRDYFYQFDVRREESPIGHFRTAPRRARAGARAAVRVRHLSGLAERLLHRVSRHAAARPRPRAAPRRLHLRVRHRRRRAAAFPSPEGFERSPSTCAPTGCGTRCYKLDADLQAAHAKFPFVVIWDDHEVANDYSGLAPEYGAPSPEFTARRAAAYQAYYEHMPIRCAVARKPRAGLRIYRRLRYGGLVEFTMLDDRQYRSDNPCGDGEVAALRRGARRRLQHARPRAGAVGGARLRALLGALERRRAAAAHRRARARHDSAGLFWNDAWDGYPLRAAAPAERSRRRAGCAIPCS